ncbi:hypothetical protein [Liberiplasma polymorphum]|uniref:hypothetical protein n=1 Tax=Liberiplasma polymorphum TaxID=3374570 RepID=UPI0037710199
MNNYNDKIHFWGRSWMLSALFLMLLIPVIISIGFSTWPKLNDFLYGFYLTAIIFWVVTTIEVFTYSPMLGSGGTYLGFVTGNLTNLKVPAAMNALNNLNVEMGSEKGEVISTIAIAASSIITTIIILLGAILILPMTPLLESPFLVPAFENTTPALFGALGMVYLAKNFKIALPSIILMSVLFLTIPGSSGLLGIFIPVSCLIAVFTARIIYNKQKA